ncbi:MAG: cytochrome b/b6 domain-containing protein [Polaromonas sp.]|nr:cytochrome b/b6 domain-containing protein [Polaromonas sp.]
MKNTPQLTESRPVWDRFVRLFHWTLVSCVLLNYLVLDDGKTLHQWVGYLALALVLARIVWGFIGSRYARFSDFFPTPARLLRHLRQLKAGQPEMHWGHNPLGALMILALISLVLGLGVTGWMQTLDAYWGEEWLQELHELLGNVLIGLATLHALAALVMGRLERTRLIRAMFTGTKERF